MELSDKKTAEMFKAVCDENRIKILKLLQGGEKCACVLLEDLHITQPTLSHHMKTLEECGLVSTRKKGKWNHYSLNRDQWTAFRDCIESIRCAGGETGEDGGCCP